MLEIIISVFAVLLAVIAGGFMYRLGLKDGLKLNKDAGGVKLDPAVSIPKLPNKEERERLKNNKNEAEEEMKRDRAVMEFTGGIKYGEK